MRATDHDPGDALSVIRVIADAVWNADAGRPTMISAGDDTARQALQRWSLVLATDNRGALA